MVETLDEIRHCFLHAVRLPAESRSDFLRSHCLDELIRREVLCLLEYDSGVTQNTADELIAGTVKAAAALALSEDGEPAPAPRVGAFEIGRLLGSGGMGLVYEAHRVDGEVRQRVAVAVYRDAIHLLDDCIGHVAC